MIKCPNCNKEVEKSNFCHECGHIMVERQKICDDCNKIYPFSYKFCKLCGNILIIIGPNEKFPTARWDKIKSSSDIKRYQALAPILIPSDFPKNDRRIFGVQG